jgi:radical SAM superfamily enzyme YgiQ (UPF0313 family)
MRQLRVVGGGAVREEKTTVAYSGPRQSVAFVELPVFSRATPLASGYMQAYANQDPLLREVFSYKKLAMQIETVTSFEKTLTAVADMNADVYAFSCYVWNARLVRRLIDELVPQLPKAKFILGGPQVMNQAHHYLSREHENLFLCNGEGEITFADFLRAGLAERPDYSTVRGLSFASGGAIHTNENMPRVADLSLLPSPFLEGVFDSPDGYHYVVWETNRGCPFKCNYCYWGGAVGAKVHKYEERRLEEELEWIARSKAPFLCIVDANWGMLKRDAVLTSRIAELRQQTGSPKYVYFSSSKNTPERNAEISKIFHHANVLTSQSIALQTLNAEALALVDRDNIKTSTYTTMQQLLNDLDVPSFVELIWPLPGETLESFKSGIGQLFELGADSVRVYNLLLMNNVGLGLKVEEYGLTVVEEEEEHSEGQVVIATRWASHEEYKKGNQFYLSAFELFVLGGLKLLARHLHRTGRCSFVELFSTFSEFCAQADRSNPYIAFYDRLVEGKFTRFAAYGEAAYITLFEHREAFDELLEQFVRAQPWWSDPQCQLLFELDLLVRPYAYGPTELPPKRYPFVQSKVSVTETGYRCSFDPEHSEMLEHLIPGSRGRSSLEIRHKGAAGHLRPTTRKSLAVRYLDCLNVTFYMRQVFPKLVFDAALGASAPEALVSCAS